METVSEHLGQQFVVENRSGAAGNLGTEAVIRASADGYTLLIASSAAAINATLFETLNFNFIRDTAPVGSIVRVPQLMQVTASLPVKSVPEFIAYAKANPGKISMGSGGNGSPAHIIGEYFKLSTGTDLTHVPYRGAAPAVADLIGGQIQVAFSVTSPRARPLRSMQFSTPRRRLSGVASRLAEYSRPATSSNPMRSVKVPPISTATKSNPVTPHCVCTCTIRGIDETALTPWKACSPSRSLAATRTSPAGSSSYYFLTASMRGRDLQGAIGS